MSHLSVRPGLNTTAEAALLTALNNLADSGASQAIRKVGGAFFNVDITGGASGITIGTTPIASGTNTRILYNNANFVGEYTLTGTGTAVVMQVAPTLTGPVIINEAIGSSGLTLTGATQTANFPVLNMTQTWNNGAVIFTGMNFNVTNTASSGASLIVSFQVGAVDKFSVRSDGIAIASNGMLAGTSGSPIAYLRAGTSLIMANTYAIQWTNASTTNGTADLTLTRKGAANLQFGPADAAAPVAQILSAQSVVAGTSNTAGVDLTTVASLSTGSAIAGNSIVATGFANIVGTTTVTITIATPGVITWAAHGLVTGSPVVFTTTGALPTGITAGTTYYAITTATLGINTFQIATTPANAQAGTAIATSGSQSGTQTGTTSATVQNPFQTIVTYGPSGLTGSQTTPAINIVQTWNTSGIATALKINVINVTSSGAAMLADFQRDGTSRASIRSDGLFSCNSFSIANIAAIANAAGVTGMNLAATLSYGWVASGTPFAAGDTFISRGGVATIQLGAPNAASPIAQTLQAQGSRSGTDSDVGGANITFQPGNGTGIGTPSSSIFKAPVVVASGTGAQTMTTWLTGTGILATFAVPVALGVNSLTLTGSIAATGSRVTKGWFTDIESTNMPTVGGVAILTSLTAPQFTTIELGAATDTTLSRVSAGVIAVEGVTVATSSNTLTLTGKSIVASQITTGTFGTGAYTMDTSLTVPQIFNSDNAIAASGNAATVTRAFKNNIVTNNSAATLTVTMSTTSAAGGDTVLVQIVDFSAVAQTITWVNTEIGPATPPATSNGSTTLPISAIFKWNTLTSKWRCMAAG